VSLVGWGTETLEILPTVPPPSLLAVGGWCGSGCSACYRRITVSCSRISAITLRIILTVNRTNK
jgi:hypothetical protein